MVDDEESARDILENLLLNFCPSVELLGKYPDLPSVVNGIQKHKPDLVFIDIEMPNYAGFEIVDLLADIDFEIVFVTAYEKYAIKAFEVSALDYLLKPIDVERLKNAVSRVANTDQLNTSTEQIGLLSKTLKTNEISSIAIFEEGCRKLVKIDNIIAFQAQEAYSKIHTRDGSKFLVSNNLKFYEDLLDEELEFFRCHKSWLINLNCLDKYSRSDNTFLLETGITARLSKYRKKDFEALIQG